MDELQRYYKESLLANLCNEYKGYWQKAHGDKEKLMRLVLRQQCAAHFADFCYRGKGLTKEYCKREFANYINGRIFNDCDNVKGYTYGMFIDATTVTKMTVDVTQFLWCNTDVSIAQTKCPRLYVSNSSNIRLVLEGYNTISIYLFDNSKLVIDDANDTCSIIVYKYSDKASVDIGKYCTTQNLKVFQKELRL